MRAVAHIQARLVPWDDPTFVQAFEHAHEEIHALATEDRTCCPEPQDAAMRVQHLLRERGWPAAEVTVEQSADEALEHTSRWTVRRDGDTSA